MLLLFTCVGMWADSESDEETDRPKFSKRNKGPKDYFAPVSFVSGGIKIGDKVTKQEEEDEITVSLHIDFSENVFYLVLLATIAYMSFVLVYS